MSLIFKEEINSGRYGTFIAILLLARELRTVYIANITSKVELDEVFGKRTEVFDLRDHPT
jgi:hypothetical protein